MNMDFRRTTSEESISMQKEVHTLKMASLEDAAQAKDILYNEFRLTSVREGQLLHVQTNARDLWVKQMLLLRRGLVCDYLPA